MYNNNNNNDVMPNIDYLIRNDPIISIKVIINWYSKLRTVVTWNGFESAHLHVLSGVRQGSVLSPM